MICSNFLTEAILWILEVEMVNSVDELKSSCSIEVITPFSRFRVVRREDCISPEQDYPEFLFQEKGQSGGRKRLRKQTGSFEEDRSLT